MEPLIISLSGLPKSGKSHFLLTAPEPIEVFDFDGGILPLVKKFPGKDIRVHSYPVDVWGKEKIEPLFQKFLFEYRKALIGDAATFGNDTATQLWEILRLAHFEKEDKGQDVKHYAFEYGKPNSIMRSTILAPRTNNKHLILTHYVREIWSSDGKRTGIIEADAFKSTEGLADLVLGFEAKAKKPTGEDTIVKVLRCRYDRELVGEELVNPTWDIVMGLLQ